ncbi:MAG: hypothetical protein ABIQ11_03600 [Saprospiraceae bacterium]
MSFSPSSCKYFISAFCCSLVFACSSNLYVPDATNVSDVNAIVELNQGRKLYIANCGGCHNLYKPEKFSTDHWTHEMVEMKEEAKITDEEAVLILKYLTGFKS